MSNDEIKNEDLVSEDIQQDAEELDQEGLVEDEQVENEETLEEGKHKKGKYESESDEDEDEDEVKEEADDEDEEDEEPEVKEISVPKTKAGVISAAVEMLKKARKEDAQKLFAKMAKVSEGEEEDSVASVDKAVKSAPQKKNELKAKAKVESIDFEEDLDAVIAEEATLSDGFRGKAGAIFEAVLTSKLAQEVERLETEYAQNLEEEVTDVKGELVEKVDSYLNYVVSNWMDQNEVAVTEGLRTELAEEFMASLQTVFKEHYIDVPEGKVDLVDELAAQVSELEESLNKTTEDNIKLHESVQTLERAEVVREQSSGLADTEAEKLGSLVEDIEFDNKDNFEMKVKVVKESYFTKEISESTDEVSDVVGTDEAPAEVSDVMNRYSQAISKFK